MIALLKPYFYWPKMSRDCVEFIKRCPTCQKFDKNSPPRNRMQMREIVSTPFERVAVNLVGPFPTATGGFRFLLTVIDLATRWPEAIPLRTTTSKVVERELAQVFARCGFPATVATDNGPQFVSKGFTKWWCSKGIEHVRSSPYHPKGNGVVEILHRTLNQMVAKTTGTKGNWAAVIPMALFFIRASPSEATGISPFLARQGWEPNTPVELLYKSWVQEDLGGVDLDEWVLINNERVEEQRERTEARLRETASKRKHVWDKKAKERVFNVNDRVWMRKLGSNLKLDSSWEGPYTIKKRNSLLSYAVDTGRRTIPSVHIQLLKEYNDKGDATPSVDRATVVLEPDKPGDDITDRFSGLVVKGEMLKEEQKEDVRQLCEEFQNTLTKKPGLTELTEFRIDTGGG